MSRKRASKSAEAAVVDYRHEAKRKNNPPAGLAAQAPVREVSKVKYAYNPHLPPVLRFDQAEASDRVFELLAEARTRRLTEEEARTLADALRQHEPWLEWAGKREKKGFEVEPVALHIHERVSAQAILKIAKLEDVQRSLFADPQMLGHDLECLLQYNNSCCCNTVSNSPIQPRGPKVQKAHLMKVRTANISDYDWIKAMAQRHKKELGYVSYGAIKDSILKHEMLVAGDEEGFCRWHKRRDGWNVIYDLVSEKKGAGKALLLAVPLPRRLKTPVDIAANGFYERMDGQLAGVEEGKKRRLNVWIWPAQNL